MKTKSLLSSIFATFLLASLALPQLEPDPNTYPVECPGDQIVDCGEGTKYTSGDPYFACSTAKFVYPQDGQVLWMCCEYQAQNVFCEYLIPPDVPGVDLDFIIVRPNKKCKSTATGQFCEQVALG